MNDSTILTILKMDLHVSVTNYDQLLNGDIATAKEQIRREGIILKDTDADGMLVVMYAAWLHRKRKDNLPMSAMLRRQLNNRLLHEKMQAEV